MIYLDYAATKPIRKEVLQTLVKGYERGDYNASSIYQSAKKSRARIERARRKIAALLGAQPKEILFTSGATEANNLAIFQAGQAGDEKVITSSIEHPSVLEAILANHKSAKFIPFKKGALDLDAFAEMMKKKPKLVSIMYVNNENGMILPITRIGKICKEHEVLFHVDAVQALGKIPIHLEELPVDMMSFSLHKIGGPKGIGILYHRSHFQLEPMIHGGLQERALRAGTENVAMIESAAKAVELAISEQSEANEKMRSLREYCVGCLEEDPNIFIINSVNQSPSILQFYVKDVDAQSLLTLLDFDEIMVSSGSACSSGSLQVSHVTKAMNVRDEYQKGAIRLSFDLQTTQEEVKEALQKIVEHIRQLRKK